MFEYDATTTSFFEIPPYFFFSVIGIVFASSLFILLLLKHNFDISRFTKIFLLSGIGLMIGGFFFGYLSNIYMALARGTPITLEIFSSSGFVFYGGLIGFLLFFLLLCKICEKTINYAIFDLVAICIPLFHFWGRLGCFFGGCCFGVETHSLFSIQYTTYIYGGEISTATRVPIQLFEALLNLIIFIFLLVLSNKNMFKSNLIYLYLYLYSIMRIFLEFLRGDTARGVWNGISFSQVVSVLIIIICTTLLIRINKGRKRINENH